MLINLLWTWRCNPGDSSHACVLLTADSEIVRLECVLCTLKVKVKSTTFHRERRGEGCSSPSSRPWARRWRTTDVCDAWPVQRQTYGYLPSHCLVPNYTAWWQRRMCVNNLPRVAFDSEAAGIQTRNLLIASLAPYRYTTKPHILHIQKCQFTQYICRQHFPVCFLLYDYLWRLPFSVTQYYRLIYHPHNHKFIV